MSDLTKWALNEQKTPEFCGFSPSEKCQISFFRPEIAMSESDTHTSEMAEFCGFHFVRF